MYVIRVVYASRAVRVTVMSSHVGISQRLGDTGVDVLTYFVVFKADNDDVKSNV